MFPGHPRVARPDEQRRLVRSKCEHATFGQRSGKPCQLDAMRGTNVCHKHGGSAPQVREAARLRLLSAADDAAAVLIRLTKKKASDSDVRQAAIAVLDRAGLKPTHKVELTGEHGGPITTLDLSKFTTEELEFFERIHKRIEQPNATPDRGLPN